MAKNDKRRREMLAWIAAAEAFQADPTARFCCPCCGRGVLRMRYEEVMSGTRIDMLINCNTCSAWTAVLLSPEASDELLGPSAAAARARHDAEISKLDPASAECWAQVARFAIGRKAEPASE
jgi:hypothetical protein